MPLLGASRKSLPAAAGIPPHVPSAKVHLDGHLCARVGRSRGRPIGEVGVGIYPGPAWGLAHCEKTALELMCQPGKLIEVEEPDESYEELQVSTGHLESFDLPLHVLHPLTAYAGVRATGM
jgi:hypothetical protein